MLGRARFWPVLTILVLAGCNVWPGWNARPSAPARATTRASTAYAAADGTPVYAKPATGAKIVAHLPQSAKVSRIGTDGGFTHVVLPGGSEGWVESGRLLRHLPSASPAAAAQSPANEAAASPAPTSTPSATEVAPTETAAPVATATATVLPSATATAMPKRKRPAIEDPF